MTETPSRVTIITNSSPELFSFLSMNESREKLKKTGKLLLIVSPLVIAFIFMAVIILTQANSEYKAVAKMKTTLRDAHTIEIIVESLQQERGLSYIFLQNRGTRESEKWLSQLIKGRQETNQRLTQIFLWDSDVKFPTKSHFSMHLDTIRTLIVLRDNESAEAILTKFDDLIKYLLTKMMREFATERQGAFWISLKTYNSLLKIKDFIGLKRATGSALFTVGECHGETYRKFVGIAKTADYLFEAAKERLPQLKKKYKSLTEQNSTLMKALGIENKYLLSTLNSPEKCVSSFEKGQTYFKDMTDYIGLITELEKDMNALINSLVNDMRTTSQKNYLLTLGLVVVLIFVWVVSMIVYWYFHQVLMSKIAGFTRNLHQKQADLKREKEKTETLLHQLIPKTMVQKVLEGHKLAPEQFESATVFFSDIKGFTSLASCSTPLQITHLLNKLYSNCDAILELYDCYKVETIGDAYIVASGIPNHNNCHSDHVCTMSLHLLRMMANFAIPHRPLEKLLMRIGCHTGPLVAGIVGNKMPKYCMFGATVDIGAKLESNGFPNRINISESCRNHLESCSPDNFRFKFNKKLQIKNRTIDSYWVLSKSGFNFSIDLEETVEALESTLYWRLGSDGFKN